MGSRHGKLLRIRRPGRQKPMLGSKAPALFESEEAQTTLFVDLFTGTSPGSPTVVTRPPTRPRNGTDLPGVGGMDFPTGRERRLFLSGCQACYTKASHEAQSNREEEAYCRPHQEFQPREPQMAPRDAPKPYPWLVTNHGQYDRRCVNVVGS
jgi:hypothetical protein